MSQTPVVGETFTFGVGLFQQADVRLLQANPAIAAGDFQRSINGAAFANLDNLPTVTPAAGRRVQVIISAAETTAAAAGGEILVIWVDQAGAQWCDGYAIIRPAAREMDDYTAPDSFHIGQTLSISVAQTIAFLLVDGSGTPVAGLGNTFTLQVSKAGGAFNASTGTKAEVASGWYTYDFTAAEVNTVGPLAVRITHASIQTQNLEYIVVNRQVGAIAFTYTVTDSGTGLPVDNVRVWITTDVAGTNTVWSGMTDAFGVARDDEGRLPTLDPGTYQFWSERAGYSFSNPDAEVVS